MRLVLTESIGAPLPIVFGVFTDLRAAPQAVRSIQSLVILSSGPIGKGTRFRETRVAFGRTTTEEMEITAIEPNRSYTVEAEMGGTHFETVYRFKADGPRTEVEMTITTRPETWWAKLLAPLFGLFAGSMKRMMAQDHADLAAVCERLAGEASADPD